eukprot:Nk52_evm8s215 gene=Nk52_evmTU8s215
MGDVDKEQEQLKKQLNHLMQLDGNKHCADCDAKGPRWASTNLGIFICMRCAGFHRSLGTHISKVKSVSLDSWNPALIENMRNTGNIRSNEVYLAKLPRDFINTDTEQFIRRKYAKKEWFGNAAESSYNRGAARKKSKAFEETPVAPPPGSLQNKYSHQLSQLRSMGFNNEHLNLRVLDKTKGIFIGDLNVAIDEIVQHPEASISSSLSQPETAPPPRQTEVPSAQTNNLSTLGINASAVQSAPKPPKAPIVDPNKYKLSSDMQAKVEELKSMGFDNEIASTEALRKAKGDINIAVDMLVILQEENEKAKKNRPFHAEEQRPPSLPPRSQGSQGHSQYSRPEQNPYSQPSSSNRAPAGSWDTNAYTGGRSEIQQEPQVTASGFGSFGTDFSAQPSKPVGTSGSEFSRQDDLLKQREREETLRMEEEEKKNSQKNAILSLYESSPPAPVQNTFQQGGMGMGYNDPSMNMGYGQSMSSGYAQAPGSMGSYGQGMPSGQTQGYGYGYANSGAAPVQTNPFSQAPGQTNMPQQPNNQYQQNPFAQNYPNSQGNSGYSPYGQQQQPQGRGW